MKAHAVSGTSDALSTTRLLVLAIRALQGEIRWLCSAVARRNRLTSILSLANSGWARLLETSFC